MFFLEFFKSKKIKNKKGTIYILICTINYKILGIKKNIKLNLEYYFII